MPDAECLGQIDTYHGVRYADWWDFNDETGTPTPLAGRSFTCHVRQGTPDQPGAVLLSVSTANGKLGVASNRLSIALTAADLVPPSGLPPGYYYYELLDVTSGAADDLIERGWWCHRPTGLGTGT
jgi:hypothetical protein